jgi:predicted outer membrane repeat protein
MRPRHLVAVFVLLALILPAAPARAGGVVSTCDEAHLLAALTGGGAVTFSCSDYIALTSTISISLDTTIDGSGQTVSINGSSGRRVFNVSSGVSLTLNSLTIGYGRDTSPDGGGGVYSNGGSVTIINTLFHDNSAYYGGGVLIRNGTLTVINSTFSGNSASAGGAILSASSTATVKGSTFSVNSAASSVVNPGEGAAIYSQGGPLTVSNSTFNRNSADSQGGAIAGAYGTDTVTNCTFSRNSADVGGNTIWHWGDGAMELRNTIVENYSLAPGVNCIGQITDGGGNLGFPDSSCPGVVANPRLLGLNSNGGPTFTMLLDRGSPAIDAAIDTICAAYPVNGVDQRGIKRPQGAHCDIGAVEQLPYSEAYSATLYLPLVVHRHAHHPHDDD